MTWSDGRLGEDEANKAIVVICADGRFSMAYTGLGTIRRRGQPDQKTVLWLHDRLFETGAGQRSVSDIAADLAQYATGVLSTLWKVERQHRGLSLVLGGFRGEQSFVMVISNQEELGTPLSGEKRDTFTVTTWVPSAGDEIALLVVGAEGALDGASAKKRWSRLQGSVRHLDEAGIAKELIGVIRAASLDLPHGTGQGQLIGKSCNATIVRPDAPPVATYHPAKRSRVSYEPYAVIGHPDGMTMAVRDLEIWRGKKPPPWWR
jgi:hypothetical protein